MTSRPKDIVVDFNDVLKTLEVTNRKAKTLLASINDSNWSGKHCEQIKAVLEIVLKYHSDLIAGTENITSTIMKFEEYYYRYYELFAYRKIKSGI